MNVRDLSLHQLSDRLTQQGIRLRTGPFVYHLTSDATELAPLLRLLYGDFPVDAGEIADFPVRLRTSRPLRNGFRSRVSFILDDHTLFRNMRRAHVLPLLEWGFNWCIYKYAHQFLLIHAAVVARDDCALLLPGPPGTGKSTICSALTCQGWRLLSDEFAVLEPAGGDLLPLARPVCLKNESIDLIAQQAPEGALGPVVHDTIKGAVAHLKPPPASVRHADRAARPTWVVFPVPGGRSRSRPEPLSKARAFFRLAQSAFNYHVLGSVGFEAMSRLVDTSACYELGYASLDDTADALDTLAGTAGRRMVV